MKKIIFLLLFSLMTIFFVGCTQDEDTDTSSKDEEKTEEEIAEEEYNLEVDEGEIKGTLALPKEEDTDTVAIIIAGSGPTDRDGNNPGAGENNSLKMLANELGKEGIASLRYDKRGIAASQDLIKKEEDLVFEDYIEDVNMWVDKLKTDDRFKKIVIIGHSEGALIGAQATVEKDVDGYISIAGAGENAVDTLRRQLSEQSQETYEKSEPILEDLENGKLVENPPEELASLFRPSVQPYLISWFKYNPSDVVEEIEVPVLIIQGKNDLQVKVDDAEKLHQANPESKLVLIENMNHILKDAPNDRTGNLETYNDPDLPLNTKLIEEVVDFIKGL